MKTDYKTIQVDLRGHVAVFTMNNRPSTSYRHSFERISRKPSVKLTGMRKLKPS